MRLYKHILLVFLILLFASPANAWMNAAIVGGGGVRWLGTYTSQYPPELTSTYVKADTGGVIIGSVYNIVDPSQSLTGGSIFEGGDPSKAILHIDLGEAKIIRRIYAENGHHWGLYGDRGWKYFDFFGTNDASAFADVTTDNTDWVEMVLDKHQIEQHTWQDQSEPQYFLVTNTTAYRYWRIYMHPGWLGSAYYCKMRRIELQTEDTE